MTNLPKQTLSVASLFSGCGGADLGMMGGFTFLGKRYARNRTQIIHASDIDKDAVATYNMNFRHEAQVKDARDISFINQDFDIVAGGFPCQSFSTVNPLKDPEDDRGQLYRELVRLGVEADAKVIIGENVKGFYTLKSGMYFRKFRQLLEDNGYTVFHRILAAHDFGVPQKRERLFVVAFRRDQGISNFDFPKPTIPLVTGSPQYRPLESVIDSLQDVPQKYFFSERAVAGVKAAKPNMKRALAQDLSQPCLTITSHLAKASLNSRDPVLLVDPQRELYRRFTPLEASRIQGFPDSFEWPDSDLKSYRQIGNAISPIVMWNLTRSVMRALAAG